MMLSSSGKMEQCHTHLPGHGSCCAADRIPPPTGRSMRTPLLALSTATLLFAACNGGGLVGSSGSSAETAAGCNFAATPNTNGCYGGYYYDNDTKGCKSASYVAEHCPADAGAADTAAPDAASPDAAADTGPAPVEDAGSGEAEGPTAGGAGETNVTSRFYTPASTPSAGLQPVIDAIGSAQHTIEMEMFNLTDTAVANALATAATNGVTVQIIIDQGNWHNAPAAVTSAIGQFVTPSAGPPSSTHPTQGFRITHVKSFVVDNGTAQATAYITSLNLTNPFNVTRDYAISTTDPNVIADFETVFQMDLANAKASPQTANSPQSFASPYTVISGNNVASMGNSVAQIHNLILSAKHSIIATSEGLGGPIPSGDANSGATTVVSDLIAMAGQGVSVQVIAPLCDENANTAYSVPALQQLNAGGAQARAMPSNSSEHPSSATLPYMHGKMIVVDGTTAYLGSVNLSEDSEMNSRELGIIVSDPATIQMLQGLFAGDWANASPETAGSFPSLHCNAI
jgi:phosphatidylserine/phosphatidylglycerophosphate/cardiolipin synthase-like enzyme